MINIPVFLASNNKYAPFVATTMASICANTKEFISFYILDSGISDNNKQKIRNTAKFFNNFNVEFVKVDCEKEFKDYPVMKHITRDMYSRFLIPSILPKAEKVIYSDIDVAFIGDIKELYDTDLGKKVIAAVPCYLKDDISKYENVNTRLELKNKKPFNSGLLIINCALWNKNNQTSKILSVAINLIKNNKLVHADQDILNKCFDGDYIELNKKYCIIGKRLKHNNKSFSDKDIAIYHYAGGGMSKPWNNKNLIGADYFWKYVPMTDFKTDIERINQKFNRHRKIQLFMQNIFSVRNSDNKKYKVIKLLGVEIFVIK